MPADANIELAVVSDLHCHGAQDFAEKRRESYLIASDARVPAGRHPIQSLISMIRSTGLQTDGLLCAGDLGHRASREGMVQSWSHLNELARELRTERLVCTLGNHDVASRGRGQDPFQHARVISPDFPSDNDAANNQFWAHGFYVDALSPWLDVIVINTAHHHFDEAEARHGTFAEAEITALQEALRSREPKRRVALLHHHPVLHSVPGYDSSDVLPTGDTLLRVLKEADCRVVIHGHKHYPRLKREIIDGASMFIFAAGSLSAYLNELSSRTRNLFHSLHLRYDSSNELWGSIRTWEFHFAEGWGPCTVNSAAFPHEAFFGPPASADLPTRISEAVRASGERYLDSAHLRSTFPEVSGLLPDEVRNLINLVTSAGDLKPDLDEFGALLGIGLISRPQGGGS
jgi:predicted phosphodiesterase